MMCCNHNCNQGRTCQKRAEGAGSRRITLVHFCCLMASAWVLGSLVGFLLTEFVL